MTVWVIISCFPLVKVTEQGKACSWQNLPGYLEVNYVCLCIFRVILFYNVHMHQVIREFPNQQHPFSCFIPCFLKNVKPDQEAMHHSDRHSCYAQSSYSVPGLVKIFLPTLTPLSALEFKMQFHPAF